LNQIDLSHENLTDAFSKKEKWLYLKTDFIVYLVLKNHEAF